MRKVKIGLMMVVLLALVACASMGSKPFGERTYEERALAIMDTYNAVYRDTMSQAMMPNLTDVERVTIRNKKALLKEVYPIITIYSGIVEQGGIPARGDEDKILMLLNQLGRRLK
jgi:hypothetical protein